MSDLRDLQSDLEYSNLSFNHFNQETNADWFDNAHEQLLRNDSNQDLLYHEHIQNAFLENRQAVAPIPNALYRLNREATANTQSMFSTMIFAALIVFMALGLIAFSFLLLNGHRF